MQYDMHLPGGKVRFAPAFGVLWLVHVNFRGNLHGPIPWRVLLPFAFFQGISAWTDGPEGFSRVSPRLALVHGWLFQGLVTLGPETSEALLLLSGTLRWAKPPIAKSLAFSESGQLLQAVPQFHVEPQTWLFAIFTRKRPFADLRLRSFALIFELFCAHLRVSVSDRI